MKSTKNQVLQSVARDYHPLAQSTSQPPQIPELAEALQSLEKTIEYSLQELRLLHSRLTPVLRPMPSCGPECSSGKCEASDESPITSQINAIRGLGLQMQTVISEINQYLAI